MKKFLISLVFICFSIFCSAQANLSGYQPSSYITNNDIKKMSKIELSEYASVVSYTIGATINGFYNEANCQGAFLSKTAKDIMMDCQAGNKIHVENIVIKYSNGRTNTLSSFYYYKDAPQLDTYRDEYCLSDHSVEELIKNPRIYVYPGVQSNDGKQYKIIHYEISSTQPDKHYEIECNSGFLNDDTKHFLQNAQKNFTFTNIKAINLNNKLDTVSFNSLEISGLDHNYVYRSALSFVKASNFDVFSGIYAVDKIEIKVFKPNQLTFEEEFEFENTKITPQFKAFIKKAEENTILNFKIFHQDKKIEMDVKIIK